ncbi:ELL factor, partial [Cisticola juncidis]|nr:ELL factor [Cisticola juncidis]
SPFIEKWSDFSIQKFEAVVSLEQLQHYKDDFNAESEEYRNLHTETDKMKKNFRQFHEQWKSLT